MNWTPSLILQILITSFEIVNEGVFILSGTTGYGKTSVFKAFLNLSKAVKISMMKIVKIFECTRD
jgi:type II secretory ATPase GspE/PulE/Tfp pilus assembly ATPase PilB-like protein